MVTSEKQNAEMLADIVKDCREAAKIRRQQNFHPLSARDVAGIYERLADSIERAAAPSRCDRCGSSGDVFVLCSGCHGPIQSPHPRGEPVGYGYSAEIQSAPGNLLHMSRVREGLYDTPLYAAPPPAGADAVREGWKLVPIEPTHEMSLAGRQACAAVADRMEAAKLTAVSVVDFWQQVGHKPADEIYRAMMAALPAPQPQEKPTGDQT